MSKTTDFPLIIIGAGAAGLGASREASSRGIEHIVLEASHRLGGRGLTEMLDNGIPVDLGCHWMHSAVTNPFVQQADRLGFSYERDNPPMRPFIDGAYYGDDIRDRRSRSYQRLMDSALTAGGDKENLSLWDLVDEQDPDLDWTGYWFSLMHSADLDQIGVSDIADYQGTDDDWPLPDGYGALIAATGADCPVRLNRPVTNVSWGGQGVKVETPGGALSAGKVIMTASTSVLGAGDIRFSPGLPEWKAQAIHDLPLGNANYLFYSLQPGALLDQQGAIGYQREDISANLRIRPFGRDYIALALGGRFAWWMEKQDDEKSRHWFQEILRDIFGSGITAQLGRFKKSAWGFDPWIRGAYSACKPGASGARKQLSLPLEERVYFAGEACSLDKFSTAHGAWLSGMEAVGQLDEK